MIKRMLVLAVAAILPVIAPAQTLTGLSVEPAQIKAGETVKVTVSFDVEGSINCGLRIHFGEGNPVDYKINQQKDVPLVTARTYAGAGEYRLMAEPKTVGTTLRCGGKSQVTTVKVAAVAAAPAAPTERVPRAARAPRAAESRCPAGWALDKKSVKKSGAFTCRAARGTPAVKLTCPGDLGYFENEKKGLMGCQP